MIKTRTKHTKPLVKKPEQFEVLLINDDYTTMDFVVLVLRRFFDKNIEDAERIMFKIHLEGAAVCGVYDYDIARTKVQQVIDFSRKNEYPLMCVLRKINE